MIFSPLCPFYNLKKWTYSELRRPRSPMRNEAQNCCDFTQAVRYNGCSTNEIESGQIVAIHIFEISYRKQNI